MARPNLDSPFISWELSPPEILQGTILTSLQVQVIQNRIALLAIEKLNFTFDPANLQRSFQEEAELQGKLRILQNLLIESENAVTEYNAQQSDHPSGE
jgi:hypothetical protein